MFSATDILAERPENATARVAWVKYLLALRGLTLSAVSQQLEVSRPAVSLGIRNGSERVEATIAEHIGVHPMELWPERYDAAGARIRQKPGPKPDTTKCRPVRRRRRKA